MDFRGGRVLLADQGIAAVDEMDKMRSEDRSSPRSDGAAEPRFSLARAGIMANLRAVAPLWDCEPDSEIRPA